MVWGIKGPKTRQGRLIEGSTTFQDSLHDRSCFAGRRGIGSQMGRLRECNSPLDGRLSRWGPGRAYLRWKIQKDILLGGEARWR